MKEPIILDLIIRQQTQSEMFIHLYKNHVSVRLWFVDVLVVELNKLSKRGCQRWLQKSKIPPRSHRK